jgi:hypothetical protein
MSLEKVTKPYFEFVNKGYDSYVLTGSDAFLQKALNITEGNYETQGILSIRTAP